MKLAILPLLVAGAGLVSAAPIPVNIIISSSSSASTFRIGHAASNIKTLQSIPIVHNEAGLLIHNNHIHGAPSSAPPRGSMMRHACQGMKDGVSRMMAIIGFSSSGPNHPPVHVTSAVLPIGHPPIMNGGADGAKEPMMVFSGQRHQMGKGKGMGCKGRARFLGRMHMALMSLGPWEGRAVAFVLGCGIGVLLRMVWVIMVVAMRAIRGPQSQSNGSVQLDEEDDGELVVPPPIYTVAYVLVPEYPVDVKEKEEEQRDDVVQA